MLAMKLGLLGALLLLPTVAVAAPRAFYMDAAGQAVDMDFVGVETGDGLVLARQMLPSTDQPVVSGFNSGLPKQTVAQSRIVYLNKNGVTLMPGTNDSRNNKSTVVNAQTTFAPWAVSASDWSETMTCMRGLFSRFDVKIVDTDPGNVPHIEGVFGGKPEQVGMPPGVAGLSPFTQDCGIIENSIVFTFMGQFDFAPRQACEIMAQEVAHSYGLDHEMLASDPMTYLSYTGNRAFQDMAASCGENAERNCGINNVMCRASQNSVQLLKERLGVGTNDLVAPTMNWSSPSANATVPPGFQVRASATDNIAVMGATLRIDDKQIDAQGGPGPYIFTTPAAMTEGEHTVVVEINDGKNVKTQTRTVTVKKGAAPDTGGGTGGGDDLEQGNVVGGCATGTGNAGLLLALGLLGLVTRRRR